MSIARRKPSNPGRRCELCGRQAETGKLTELGWAGPECQRKVAALPKILEALQIKGFTGVFQVPARREGLYDVTYGHPYEALVTRLGTAGLTLTRVGGINWGSERPMATFRIAVKRVRKFNASIKSFEQTRREFAARLKAGSASRRAAALAEVR